jgi:hypothetical protein
MLSQISIVVRLVIVSVVLLGALGSVRAQEENLPLLIITEGEQPQLIQYDPLMRQEVIRPLELDTLPQQLRIWDSTTLLGMDTTSNPRDPITMYLIDIGSGQTRCSLTIAQSTIGYLPDLENLTFFGSIEGQLGVYTLDSATCALETLMALPDDFDGWAGASPDAAWVVYTKDDSATGLGELHLLEVANGADILLNEILVPASIVTDLPWAWSPDGILFIYTTQEGMYRYNLRTGEQQQIIEAPDAPTQALDWSSDGRYVLYGGFSYSGVIDLTTGEFERIDVGEYQLYFTADERWIWGEPYAHQTLSPWVMWSFEDGRIGADRLADTAIASLSPDEQRLVYFVEEGAEVFNLETATIQPVDLQYDYDLIQWMPNGEGVYTYYPSTFEMPMRYHLLDSGETRILSETALPFHRWSPDAEFLLYLDMVNYEIQMNLHNVSDNHTQLLFTVPFQSQWNPYSVNARWSADNRFLAIQNHDLTTLPCSMMLVDAQTGETWSPVCDGTTVQFYWLP